MKSLSFLFTTTFFPPYHLGGDATHVYHLSCELAKRGHEVHVVHWMDSYYWQRKGEPDAIQYPLPGNVVVHPLWSTLGKLAPPLSYISGIPFSLRDDIDTIIKNVKPDVIHHHNVAGFGPWIFGLKAPVRVYTAHDQWLTCQMNLCLDFAGRICNRPKNCFFCSAMSGRPPQLWRCSPTVLKKALQNIDLIISPSHYLKQRLAESGIRNQITVIPNFIPEPLEPGPPLYTDQYFLFVGALEKHKGIIELVNTFVELKSDLNAKLFIAGNGSLGPKIDAMISDNNCGKKIIRLGRIDDFSILSNLYFYADALIIPSHSENCPMVALEALAHGTPIFTSDVGGLQEITRKLDSEFIIKTSDDLKNILLKYDKKKKSNFVRCKKVFNQNFSIRVVDNYLKLVQCIHDKKYQTNKNL
jgi:glycosyltransferase involved in cell wall biosynthesis